MGRPPQAAGVPVFRFLPQEVAQMERALEANNNIALPRPECDDLAEAFTNTPERAGQLPITGKQVLNWFQNRRHSQKAKKILQMQQQQQHQDSGRGFTPSPLANAASPMQYMYAPPPEVEKEMDFEAKSSRDGAWYDVSLFLAHRIEASEHEVRVRFVGFGSEEDEWVDVKTSVRQRSMPCDVVECMVVLPGDLILCFQEGNEQALYYDATVLDIQRRRHDLRGCRCRFWVRYDHDQSETARDGFTNPQEQTALKKRWAEEFAAASASTSSPQQSACNVVAELVESLVAQRQRREVALRLREALRDVKANFSFARVKGLRRLLAFLMLAAASERGVELFRESQSYQELQVIPALFKHTLAPQKSPASAPPVFNSSEEAAEVSNPPTPAEIVLALRVLEGCCLVDNSSKAAAAHHMAVKELLDLLSATGIPERTACLDALLALLLDSPANQKEFEYYRGVSKICDSLKNRHVDVALRTKCAEFLLLLVGDILPKTEALQDQLKEWMGTECCVILWDVYSNLEPAFADPERKKRSLKSLAEKMLSLVDS
ncbi:hypothetical protein SELMODRAFT_405582 [Selaginella moellendorffii]|uniref:Homeobox domain-containing protein n=1 Tax=Selaginella moellendorffii TaxID=88036 RepID=D8QZ18_SELML|nr:hypothetical protein SELMODRAFT_405582 [Selaginella moellendorffii]